MGGLTELFAKLARPPEEIRAENLRAWSGSLEGVTAIDRIGHRERHRVAGVIDNIRIDPRRAQGSIEATITDGTGELVVRWLGRPTMSGIRLGMGLIAEGIVGEASDGEPMLMNPDYQLVPGPEHG